VEAAMSSGAMFYEHTSNAKRIIMKELQAAFPRVEFRPSKYREDRGRGFWVTWLDGPGTDEVQCAISKFEIDENHPNYRDRSGLVFFRNQTCPKCNCDVTCPDPTEPSKVSCYVCGANGGGE
jgi:hypothetical protein